MEMRTKSSNIARVSGAVRTCATGHPAISLPCGTTPDGRPVGAQLVGPRFGEETIYRAAAALESALR